MRFSEICKKCENKFVVETDDDLNPCFIGCLRCDIYEKIMKKPSNYEWMKHVYAFSPENVEFINPSKEFNFGILKDMIEEENPCSLTMKLSEDKMLEMFVKGSTIFQCECPLYTEIVVEKWNASESEGEQ